MDKPQIKPKKDKKKNTETGMLMGQNTNVFSQLSATYLQNKTNFSQEQANFVNSTQIIEYHDPNINRIIALLRKKADVTKVKAAQELKEQLLKMNPQTLQEFMPTFSQLYMETIINEQSKQVIDEFIYMMNHLMANNKKIVIKQIGTIFAPFLVSNKSNAISFMKGASLLFNGTEEQIIEKSFVLLVKKQVKKKFLVFCKIILQCEEIHKIGQQNYQRNCSALAKVLKDFLRFFDTAKLKQQTKIAFSDLILEIDQLLNCKAVKEYFKVGGKAKGSILELYQGMIGSVSVHNDWKIEWEKYAKTLCQNYLEKDLVVQQTLWKHCNRHFIESCLRLQKEEQKEKYSIFIKYLPKPDQKLLSVLKLGGIGMYKELPSYMKVFPFSVFQEGQSHKNTINKLNFIRKLMQTILELEDENQARIEAYYELCCLFISRLKEFGKYFQLSEEKKHQQIHVLIKKTQKQLVQNLQECYYENPPASRNSFTFYVPPFFCKLLSELELPFNFIFNQVHSFALYSNLQSNTPFCEEIRKKIYQSCQNNSQLTLTYLQTFSAEPVKLDMSENNSEIQISAKTFLLSTHSISPQNWFLEDWDLKKQVIVYDPRITKEDLAAAQQNQGKLNYYFRPSGKAKLYDKTEHDLIKLKYFLNTLRNQELFEIVPLLVPEMKDKIMKRRREESMEGLLQVYWESARQLEGKKWIVGAHEVLKIRVVSDLIVEMITSNEKLNIKQNLVDSFLRTICLFSLNIHNYKMEEEAEELLKIFSKLSFIDEFRDKLLLSVKATINQAYSLFNKLNIKNQTSQDKIRKNRLHRCLNFVRKVLWHCGRKLNTKNFIDFFKDLLTHEDGWKEATNRPDLWLLGQCLLSVVEENIQKRLSMYLVQNHKEYGMFIGLMMSCRIVLPLQRQPEAKKAFLQLQEIMVKQIVALNAEAQLSLLHEVINHTFEDNSLTLIYGAKSLISMMMKNYQSLQKGILHKFLQECIQRPLKIVEKEDLDGKIKATLLLNTLCVELPLLDIEEIKEVYSTIDNRIKSTKEDFDFMVFGSMQAALWEVGVGFKQFQVQNITQFINRLLDSYQSLLLKFKENTKIKNFVTYSVLVILYGLYPIEGKEKLTDKWNILIEELVWVTVEEGSFLSGVVEANRMKLISRYFLSFEKPMKEKIAQEIPIQTLKQLNSYKDILDQIDLEDESTIHHENVITMFVEFAEVLIKIASGLNNEVRPKEEVMLGLLQCPFPGIKKTAFLLLKQMYGLNLVNKQIPNEFKKYLDLPDISGEEIQWVVGEITSYLYSWQTLLYRRAIEKLSKDEQYSITLEDYLQKDLIYEQFLKNIFQILENQLQFTKRQQEYDLSAEELVSTDTVIVSEDELNLSHKLYRLTLRTLFLFILNFPLFLRDFMDRSKKYKNICDRLLRNILSDAIFKEEILKIQMQEHEWKSMGNFQIYVTPKNKQIYAQYTHDTIRIGLRLVMRSNYPLTPIAIEFGEGLKMEDGSRWALMLQSQLHSRNNTIINGILLWKENIDKRLSGVEECSICFDIVNNSGQLPKKGCKTCHKKFHGNCIMKWFSKSNKSQCPLCKSQFL